MKTIQSIFAGILLLAAIGAYAQTDCTASDFFEEPIPILVPNGTSVTVLSWCPNAIDVSYEVGSKEAGDFVKEWKDKGYSDKTEIQQIMVEH